MKILVVEDNPEMGRCLQRGIEGAGWTADLAKDGEEALYHTENASYDVIAADWMLPRLSGIDFIKELRAKGNLTPILMISARGAVKDRVSGIETGADDYIVKPFEMVEFLVRLSALCRRSVGKGSAEFQLGDLKLNFTSNLVHLSGNELDLTRKEYDFLRVLAMKHDQIVNRADLISALYSVNDEPDSNSLDVILNRLRKKLQGSSVQIATIRGRGFLLRASNTLRPALKTVQQQSLLTNP